MADTSFQAHIRFADIASNPYILSIYKGLHSFAPNTEWWIFDEQCNRYPFPSGTDMSLQEFSLSDDLAEHRQSFQQLGALDTKCSSDVYQVDNGTYQGIINFCFHKNVIGGIGISNISEDQLPLLRQIIKIIDGYLTLLGSALEDHEDLEIMHNIWAETITMIDLEVLLERVMDELCNLLELGKGIILLINEDGEFYPAYVRNYPEKLLKLRNIDVTRYDYTEPMAPPTNVLRKITRDDPLHRWLENSLKDFGAEDLVENQYCLSVPFYRNTYMTGIFLTMSSCVPTPSDNRHSLLRLLTTGAAAALDNALTLERMNQRRKALSTIHVVHRLISSRITPKELLPKIGQLTRQLLQTKKCSIMLCNEDRTRLIPKVSIGMEKSEVGNRGLEMGEELPGWVAENFNPILYHPTGQAQPPWKSIGDTYPSYSYMAVALFDNDIEGVIIVADKKDEFTPGDREILLTFAEQAVLALKNARLHEGERTITINALKSIANLIEMHDPERSGITVQTCEFVQKISRHLNLNESEYQNITFGALLHDSGMLRTLQQDLSKEEHQEKGPELSLRFVQSLGLSENVERMVYHVNEKWNGSGYPDQLKSSQIPLGSRIIAVANAYTVLHQRLQQRGYDKKMASEKALHILNRLKNRSFDPDIVNALEQVLHNPSHHVEEERLSIF